MFGNKKGQGADSSPHLGGIESATESRDDVLRAAGDRLEALSMSQLAAEVMARTFGPEGPGADRKVTVDGAPVGAGPTVGAIAARRLAPDAGGHCTRALACRRSAL